MSEPVDRAAGRIVASLVEAWNIHDADAFAQVFAEDADFTNVFGMRARGRGEIAGFHAPIFRTIFKDSRLAATETRVRGLRDDIAAVDVRWTMTGARSPDGAAWPRRDGVMSMILARDGGWQIVVLHNMDLPPAEMAEAQAALQQAHR